MTTEESSNNSLRILQADQPIQPTVAPITKNQLAKIDTDKPVADGRLRVNNFDFMESHPKRKFIWFRIDANDNCNLKCTYCRVPRSTQTIDENKLQEFLMTKVASVKHLQFGCGMEPTLDPRLADMMMKASLTPAKPADQFTIQTNGTLLHKHDHLKMRAAGMNRISVSIDSLDADVHKSQRGGSNVNKIIQNLTEFHRNCPDVDMQFICVVTTANIATAKELAKFAVDLGVRRMAFRQMVYVQNHPLVVEEDILPLIVKNEDFYEMKKDIEGAIGNKLEMSFYDTSDLNQHRQKMRKGSYYEKHADKPIQATTIKVTKDMDLLEDKQFFVLRGFMKSGTNWIGRLLNLHPEISCAGEFHWQTITMPFLQNIERSKLLREKEGLRNEMWKRLDRCLKECVVLANHPDAKWVGDRTPSRIQPGILIGSKVFHLVRDGRDVLISRAYHFFNNATLFPRFLEMPENQKRLRAFKKDSQFFVKNPLELLACNEFVKDSAHYWAQHVRTDLDRIQNAYKPTDVHNVRYEEVHQDTEAARIKMYEFLEVDPSLAADLSFNTQPGFEKEMPNRFLRKGAVGDWRNYMSPETIEIFNQQAGEIMLRLEYIDSLNWGVSTPLRWAS